MAESLGTAFVDLVLNNASYNQSLKDSQNIAKTAATGMEQAFTKVKSVIIQLGAVLGVAFSVGALISYAKEATILASRVETLGVVLRLTGENAGFSSMQTKQYVEQVKAMGITTQAAQDSITKMAQAQMDLSKAGQLSRIAQDAAVIANINSSEAFTRMIYGIKSGQTEVLKTMGINVSFEESYRRLETQLGKSRASFSEQEKVMARTNALIEYGPRILGVYEASMGTAGKAMLSLARYTEEVQLKIGTLTQPALKVFVDAITASFKGAGEAIDGFINSGDMAAMARSIGEASATIVKALFSIGSAAGEVISVLRKFGDEIKAITYIVLAFAVTKTIIVVIDLLAVAYVALTAKVYALSTAFYTLSTAISTNPIGLALVLAALGATAFVAWKNSVSGAGDAAEDTAKQQEELTKKMDAFNAQTSTATYNELTKAVQGYETVLENLQEAQKLNPSTRNAEEIKFIQAAIVAMKEKIALEDKSRATAKTNADINAKIEKERLEALSAPKLAQIGIEEARMIAKARADATILEAEREAKTTFDIAENSIKQQQGLLSQYDIAGQYKAIGDLKVAQEALTNSKLRAENERYNQAYLDVIAERDKQLLSKTAVPVEIARDTARKLEKIWIDYEKKWVEIKAEEIPATIKRNEELFRIAVAYGKAIEELEKQEMEIMKAGWAQEISIATGALDRENNLRKAMGENSLQVDISQAEARKKLIQKQADDEIAIGAITLQEQLKGLTEQSELWNAIVKQRSDKDIQTKKDAAEKIKNIDNQTTINTINQSKAVQDVLLQIYSSREGYENEVYELTVANIRKTVKEWESLKVSADAIAAYIKIAFEKANIAKIMAGGDKSALYEGLPGFDNSYYLEKMKWIQKTKEAEIYAARETAEAAIASANKEAQIALAHALTDEEIADARKQQANDVADAVTEGKNREAAATARANESIRQLEAKIFKNKMDQVQNSLASMESGFTAIKGMYKEGTAEYDKWQEAANAMAAAQKVVAMVSAIAAIASAASGPWPLGFASMVAMAAAMGSLLSSIGGLGSIGGAAGASVPAKASTSVQSSTILGATEGQGSESLSNVTELLKDIHAEEYSELRGIRNAIEELNNSIFALVNSIARNYGKFTADTWKELDLSFQKSASRKLWDSVGISGMGSITTPLGKWLTDVFSQLGSWLFGGDVTKSMSAAGFRLDPVSIKALTDGTVKSIGVAFGTVKSVTAGGIQNLWKSSTSYSTTTKALDDDVNKWFIKVYQNLGQTAIALAKVFGTDMQAALAYIFPAFELDLLNLSPEEVTKKLQSWISNTGDVMAKALFGELIEKYQKIDEGLLETAIRLATGIAVVRQNFALLGKTFEGTTAYLIEYSQAMIDAAGGLEELQKGFSAFFEYFFTSAERHAAQFEMLSSIMEKMGLVLPDTAAAFRALVMSIEDPELLGQIIGMMGLFVDFYSYVDEIESKYRELEIRAMGLLGDATGALVAQRELELEALDESLWPMQQYVWALEDIRTEQELQIKLMEAVGMATEALALKRKLELGSLQKSLWKYQEAIWAIEDAETALSTAEKNLRDAFANEANEYNLILEEVNKNISILQGYYDKLKSARESMRLEDKKYEKGMYQWAQAELARILNQVKLGNFSDLETVDRALSELTKSNKDQFTNSVDYQRDFWRTYHSIAELEMITGDQLSVEEQIAAGVQEQINLLDQQLDALLGINNTIMSLADAIAQYEAAKIRLLEAQNAGRGLANTPIVPATSPGAWVPPEEPGGGGGGGSGAGTPIYVGNDLPGLPSEDPWSAANPALFAAIRAANPRYYWYREFPGVPYPGDQPGPYPPYVGQPGSPFGPVPPPPEDPPNWYAEGGYHEGGWRWVGEQGPELEYTGSSRIFSSAQSQNLLDVSEVVEEVRQLRQELEKSNYQMLKNSNRVTKFIDKWDGDGLPDTRTLT